MPTRKKEKTKKKKPEQKNLWKKVDCWWPLYTTVLAFLNGIYEHHSR